MDLFKAAKSLPIPVDQLTSLFKSKDKDGSGFLSVETIKGILASLNIDSSLLQKFISSPGKVNDGNVNYGEFLNFLKK
ncbi:uncharacterized protein LOC116936816 [Petromyzon marinus]|uniref:Calcium-dependent protein kinase 7-like isoform X1 n=1 Tax=Petromyzon marinus TaxID=7757 RepID=A0AAJ7SIR0_PETMA|nr:calcium-dependent protein kinase 7-like isoform X1 [Petromyzon marinus]XP_032799860.1 calcium-dependent protein kinase 7-like isoform X2 [Petromyzon marinus]